LSPSKRNAAKLNLNPHAPLFGNSGEQSQFEPPKITIPIHYPNYPGQHFSLQSDQRPSQFLMANSNMNLHEVQPSDFNNNQYNTFNSNSNQLTIPLFPAQRESSPMNNPLIMVSPHIHNSHIHPIFQQGQDNTPNSQHSYRSGNYDTLHPPGIMNSGRSASPSNQFFEMAEPEPVKMPTEGGFSDFLRHIEARRAREISPESQEIEDKSKKSSLYAAALKRENSANSPTVLGNRVAGKVFSGVSTPQSQNSGNGTPSYSFTPRNNVENIPMHGDETPSNGGQWSEDMIENFKLEDHIGNLVEFAKTYNGSR